MNEHVMYMYLHVKAAPNSLMGNMASGPQLEANMASNNGTGNVMAYDRYTDITMGNQMACTVYDSNNNGKSDIQL